MEHSHSRTQAVERQSSMTISPHSLDTLFGLVCLLPKQTLGLEIYTTSMIHLTLLMATPYELHWWCLLVHFSSHRNTTCFLLRSFLALGVFMHTRRYSNEAEWRLGIPNRVVREVARLYLFSPHRTATDRRPLVGARYRLGQVI